MKNREAKRLQSQLCEPLSLPIIGRCLQKKAVTALAEDGSPEAIKVLAEAVIALEDEEIKGNIFNILNNIKDQKCIDSFCHIWANTRHRDLTSILVKQGWVATAPANIRVLSALKTNDSRAIANDEAEIVEPLLDAFQDTDTEIANRASQYALSLTNQNAIDYLCQQWGKTRDSLLEQLICKGKYVAQQPIDIRVLTALKVRQPDLIINSGKEIVEPLLKELRDGDTVIAKQARKCSISLTNQQAIDYLCQKWSDTRNELLEKIICQGKYIAKHPVNIKVLTALKTGQLDEISNGGQEIVESLISALRDQNTEIANQARKCSISLTNQQAIDYLCQKWSDTRNGLLEQIICKGNYLAQEPAHIRVLTALKVNRLEIIKNGGTEIVKPLLDATKDSDSEIVDRANECAVSLSNSNATNFICGLAIDNNHDLALKIAIKAKYAPDQPGQKALFYFLTEQWDKYESLDYDHTLLQKVYEFGNEHTRKRIAEQARKEGRVEWVEIVAGRFKDRRLGEMTNEEWETTTKVLCRNDNFEAIWRWAKESPAIWSKVLLQKLDQVGWIPSILEEIESFEKLKYLASKCLTNILSISSSVNCIATIHNHTDLWHKITFSPDGHILAACSQKTIKLWTMPNGKILKTFSGHDDSIFGIKFSSDGKILASYSIKNVKLWCVSNGKLLATLSGHTESVEGIKFSPDGKILASYSIKNVKLWCVSNGKLLATLSGHTESVDEIIFRPGGKIPGRISFSPDGKIIATCSFSRSDKNIRLWRITDGKLLATLSGHTESVEDIKFSPNGKIIASFSFSRPDNKNIRLWRITDGKLLATLSGHTKSVYKIQFSPDGKILAAAGCCENTIDLWHMPDGKPLTALSSHTESVSRIEFSPDGKVLAGLDSSAKIIELWRIPDGKSLAKLYGGSDYIYGRANNLSWTTPRMCFSFDGQLLTSYCQKIFRMWKIPSGEPLAIIADPKIPCWGTTSHPDPDEVSYTEKVIFSPNTQIVATCHHNQEIKLWSSNILQSIYCPVKKLSYDSNQFIKQSNNVSQEERYWLEFMQELINLHRRFNVEIEDMPQSTYTGEFDIDIEN